MEETDVLESFFPDGYEYQVIFCDMVETSSLPFADVNFDMELRANVDSIEKVKEFLRKFNDSSSSTFII